MNTTDALDKAIYLMDQAIDTRFEAIRLEHMISPRMHRCVDRHLEQRAAMLRARAEQLHDQAESLLVMESTR